MTARCRHGYTATRCQRCRERRITIGAAFFVLLAAAAGFAIGYSGW